MLCESHPAKGAQPANRIDPRLGRSYLLELLIDRGDLRIQRDQVTEHVLQCSLSQRVARRWALSHAWWRWVHALPSR